MKTAASYIKKKYDCYKGYSEESIREVCHIWCEVIEEAQNDVKKEYEEKLRWIPIEEKEPICILEDEGIHYSKYLEIKVKGYEHPFIGFYVKANDDQFFDFIHKSVDEGIKQEEITHYRFVIEA